MPDIISFQAAGVHSISFIGIIKYLEEKGEIADINIFAGSSGGILIATLLSIGYTLDELTEISKEITDYLLDIDLGGQSINVTSLYNKCKSLYAFPVSVYKLLTNKGYFKGKLLENYIDGLIKKKTNKNKTTFKELHDISGKELHISVTELNYENDMKLSVHTTPDMPVSKAVRAGCAHVILYAPVEWEGNVITNGKSKKRRLLMADGGATSPLPVDVFFDMKKTILLCGVTFPTEPIDISFTKIFNSYIRSIQKTNIAIRDKILEAETTELEVKKVNVNVLKRVSDPLNPESEDYDDLIDKGYQDAVNALR